MMPTHIDGDPVEEYKAEPEGDSIFAIRHEDDDTWTLWCERGADHYALLNDQGQRLKFSQPDAPAGLFSTWTRYEDFADNQPLKAQWLSFMERSKVSPLPETLNWKQGPTTAGCG